MIALSHSIVTISFNRNHQNYYLSNPMSILYFFTDTLSLPFFMTSFNQTNLSDFIDLTSIFISKDHFKSQLFYLLFTLDL
jgi:hypothetical protein